VRLKEPVVYVQRACSTIAAVVLVFPVEPIASFVTRQDGTIYKVACIE
jgi:hypothetical protein